MKLSAVALVLGFQATTSFVLPNVRSRPTFLRGYLDDLSKDLYGPDGNPIPDEETREATNMAKEDLDRFGVGSWDNYVEFDEFDGGDGQMGVAGDGNKQLEKFDMSEMAKSKARSAKNAWGRSTGYADTLIDQGVDNQRAQQLENWHNQQEILKNRQQQRYMTEEFDRVSTEDEDWRKLASFGVERNQEFDMDEEFGAVQAGDAIEGVIELTGRLNGPAAVHEMGVRNEYMGFADFRAAFTPTTGPGWTITPNEGSLMQREDTNFVVRFRPQSPGVSEGHLVIETEDFKKTWKLIGGTS